MADWGRWWDAATGEVCASGPAASAISRSANARRCCAPECVERIGTDRRRRKGNYLDIERAEIGAVTELRARRGFHRLGERTRLCKQCLQVRSATSHRNTTGTTIRIKRAVGNKAHAHGRDWLCDRRQFVFGHCSDTVLDEHTYNVQTSISAISDMAPASRAYARRLRAARVPLCAQTAVCAAAFVAVPMAWTVARAAAAPCDVTRERTTAAL